MVKATDKMWEAIAGDIQKIKSLPDDIEVYVDNKYRQSVLSPKNIIYVNSEMMWIDYGLGDSRVLIVRGDLDEFEGIEEKYVESEARYMIEDIFTLKKPFKLDSPEVKSEFLTRY